MNTKNDNINMNKNNDNINMNLPDYLDKKVDHK